MNIRKIFGVVLMVMCAITINMYGQNEDLRQKYDRLATDADAHPADWKKQYDVAQMLIKEGSELFDQEKAGKFYERIYHVASDVNAAVPDSAFYESTYILMLNAINQKDIQKALSYADEITRYGKLKNDPYNSFSISAAALAAPMMMMVERSAAGVDKIKELRKLLAGGHYEGVENTDVMMVFLYDQVMNEYRDWIGDKLMEITIDGKPYVLLAMGAWNVEQPFMGWSADTPDAKTVFADENLKVYDDLHGAMEFNFNWDEKSKAVVKTAGTTARLITVTPEQRQRYVEAYKKYLKQ